MVYYIKSIRNIIVQTKALLVAEGGRPVPESAKPLGCGLPTKWAF